MKSEGICKNPKEYELNYLCFASLLDSGIFETSADIKELVTSNESCP